MEQNMTRSSQQDRQGDLPEAKRMGLQLVNHHEARQQRREASTEPAPVRPSQDLHVHSY